MTLDELVGRLREISPEQPFTDETWMWQGGRRWLRVPDVIEDWRDEHRRVRDILGRDPVEVALAWASVPGIAEDPRPPPVHGVPAVSASPSEPADGYWRARRTAAFLGMSESWVYHRAAEGRLPCVRIGGALRFEPDAIKAFVRGEGAGRGRTVALAK